MEYWRWVLIRVSCARLGGRKARVVWCRFGAAARCGLGGPARAAPDSPHTASGTSKSKDGPDDKAGSVEGPGGHVVLVLGSAGSREPRSVGSANEPGHDGVVLRLPSGYSHVKPRWAHRWHTGRSREQRRFALTHSLHDLRRGGGLFRSRTDSGCDIATTRY